VTPTELIEWGFALGLALGAAVQAFVFALDLLGIEWESFFDREEHSARDKTP
jgi:hypothetical protein